MSDVQQTPGRRYELTPTDDTNATGVKGGPSGPSLRDRLRRPWTRLPLPRILALARRTARNGNPSQSPDKAGFFFLAAEDRWLEEEPTSPRFRVLRMPRPPWACERESGIRPLGVARAARPLFQLGEEEQKHGHSGDGECQHQRLSHVHSTKLDLASLDGRDQPALSAQVAPVPAAATVTDRVPRG